MLRKDVAIFVIKPSLQINIHTIRITDVDTGSAVAIGNNYFFDWKTFSKSNTGFGRLNGDYNSLCDTALEINDPDLQDMICNERPEESNSSKILNWRDKV